MKLYRQPDSISLDVDKYVMLEKINAQDFNEISLRPKLLSKYYFGIGNLLCVKGNAKAGVLISQAINYPL
jgi:hypothetical protein